MPAKSRLATIQICQIEVGDRFREDMGNLDELAQSIKDRGQIQPICVQEYQSEDGKEYLLLGGERRLKACQLAGLDTVDAKIFTGDVSEYERRSIELAENYYRKGFEWREEIAIKAEIDKLQVLIHGEKIHGTNEGWSNSDTARMLGVDKSTLSKDLALHTAVENFPDLFGGCKNKQEATKVLKKVGEQMLREELAKRVEQTCEGTPVNAKQKLMQSYVVGNFFDHVKDVPDKSCQLVEIDPPYAIDLAKQKSDYSYVATYNEVDAQQYADFMQKTLAESYRVMTDHSWLICWFGPDPWFESIFQWIVKAGFTCSRLCGIWVKGAEGSTGQGQTKAVDYNLGAAYEMFFYARKGSPPIARPGRTNVFPYVPTHHSKKFHPTERPVELLEDILSTFAFEGSRVLVPFAGSGNTLRAAYRRKMNAFGYDLTKEYRDGFIVNVETSEQ